eukprot:TRINITY_DN105849_c0_g1_i1.p1 TRINITY_DN105849_c0_g1~~TRINITY_DN105849_c0_g1_i1.p1  ORF type:complete len:430 (-),score=78.39 TRINITY_DN105849_c0_g1_i1:256-1545(-)
MTVPEVGPSALPPPSCIWIVCPSSLTQHCAGQYELVKEQANGKPLWKKTSDDLWIYKSKMGYWCIAGADAKSNNFDCDVCFMYRLSSKDDDPNAFPGAVHGGAWQCWDESKQTWLADPAVRITDVPLISVEERTEVALREVALLRKDKDDAGAARSGGLALLGLDLTTPIFNDEDGNTLLMNAADRNWVDLAAHLVQARPENDGRQAYLDSRSSDPGWTALFIAARQGYAEIAYMLLEAQASPNLASTQGGLTPLMLAASQGRAELCEALLAARADPGATLRDDGRTAKDFASSPEARQILHDALATAQAAREPVDKWSAEARTSRRRRRTVTYGKGENVRIDWHLEDSRLLVRRLADDDPAQAAGVQAGWELLAVNGSETLVKSLWLSSHDSLRLPPSPVSLQFGRPVDLPNGFWHAHLANVLKAENG